MSSVCRLPVCDMCLGVKVRRLIWLLINHPLLRHQNVLLSQQPGPNPFLSECNWCHSNFSQKCLIWGTRCEVLPLCVCVSSCCCVCANVCVYEVKGESIFTRWLREGIGLTTAQSCLWRNNPVIWQHPHAHMHTRWSCFDSSFWHSLTLISWLYRERQGIAALTKQLLMPECITQLSRRHDERSPLMVSSHRPLASNSPSTITWCNTTYWWQMKDIHQSKCLHTPNLMSQLTGARWILNTLWQRH